MGRRWGKTVMGGSVALAAAANGAAVAWIVPTYRNARALWRFVESHAGGVAQLRRAEMSAMLGRGHVTIYTAENDTSIRGESFDLAIIDEAAQIREETWSDVIMPTLADRAGRAMLISTPKGRNWFFNEYVRGKSDGNFQASFNAPSSDNPMPTIQAAARMARERVSERTWRQEWLAEFVDDGAGVFRFIRAISIAEPEEPIPGRQYIIGRDWARTNDSSVSSVWDVSQRREVRLDIESDVPFSIQIQRLRALAQKYNDAIVVAERNSIGDPLIEQSTAAGLRVIPFITTNATKASGVDMLALACEQKTITLQNDSRGIFEMESFEASRTQTGLVRYSHPPGGHDDIVMARVFAMSGLSLAGGSTSAENPFF